MEDAAAHGTDCVTNVDSPILSEEAIVLHFNMNEWPFMPATNQTTVPDKKTICATVDHKP